MRDRDPLGLRRFFLSVLAAESFHAAGRIHQFLLASKERMAIGANFYVDVALVGRTSAETVAARAHYADLVVSGMNGCLHGFLTSFPNHSILKDARRIQQMGWLAYLLDIDWIIRSCLTLS